MIGKDAKENIALFCSELRRVIQVIGLDIRK